MADAGRRWCCGRYAHPRSSSVLGTSRDDFSPEKLATCLKDALFGYTASADFIIYILAIHSHKQCQAICRHYHLLTAQKKFADIATFIELLGAQNNYNMQKIKEIFYKMYRCELDDAAEKEVHGHFQKIIALLLKTDRDESFKVDHQKVEEDAKVLRAAGVGIKYASDAAVLFTFLNSRSYSHLKKMFEAYHRLTGKTIQEKIKNEFVTECFQHALVLYVNIIEDPLAFYAEEIYKCLHNEEDQYEKLIRIFVLRLEVDLADINNVYFHLYGETLGSAMTKFGSGGYNILKYMLREFT
ncbi:annexin A3-like [Schistocerca serialis cubense]|uniref:annexin A3-like n=1 Tax=Schistocerca serialis cubense TaxID=2023355 RepID=UPI00214E2A82|nr:annexin A3-like [Schistocerca serialis cubense]